MDEILKSIAYLKSAKEYAKSEPNELKSDTETITNLFNTAIEALEKQIAKKPTNKGKTFTKHWLCPTCNRLYWERGHLDGYCMSCGQKFDLD